METTLTHFPYHVGIEREADTEVEERIRVVDRTKPVVFVVDDDLSIRKSLRLLLRSVGLDVETFPSGEEFLDAYDPAIPGCLVLDVRMPGISGVELQAELLRRQFDIPVVIITGHGDLPIAVRSLKAGALDFVVKPFSDEVLLDALRQALEEDRRRRRRYAEIQEIRDQIELLTPREREVMDLVVSGKASKQIAAMLNISQKTVESHRLNLMKKLRVECVADVVRMGCLIPAHCN